MTPEGLITIARSWLGVPFRHQGNTRRGIDCINAVRVWLVEAGLSPPEVPQGYLRSPDGVTLKTALDGWMTPTDTPQPGTIALLRIRRFPQHVALITGPTMIHSHSRVGKGGREMGGVVENGYRGRWLDRTVALYRVPGVIYE
jgi:cell wall-associated NlpC family hydrolase